jgi:cytidine deaminase
MNRRSSIAMARAARKRAYAPYSRYRVGAALLCKDGRAFAGCNVENASYGLTVCAERNAVLQALAAGCRRFEALVVATEDGAAPCGACLQVVREFAADLPITLVDARGRARDTSLAELLPHPYVRARRSRARRATGRGTS